MPRCKVIEPFGLYSSGDHIIRDADEAEDLEEEGLVRIVNTQLGSQSKEDPELRSELGGTEEPEEIQEARELLEDGEYIEIKQKVSELSDDIKATGDREELEAKLRQAIDEYQ